MIQLWLTALLVFSAPCLIVASGVIKIQGIVFSDTNRNGTFDAGESGVEGVCISNGKDVVQTKADGSWELTIIDDKPVFVIKPSGFDVPLNEYNVPQHYVMHQDLNAAADVHFPLIPSKENSRFTALFFGDTQARGLKEVNYIMHDVVEECIGMEAVFGVSLGDIVADDPNLFEEVSQGIGQIGIPWYNLFGNHDHDRHEKNNEDKDKTFRKFFGPATYAFEYGQVAFIGLNNIFFRHDGRYIPHLTENQLEFVENYLEFVSPDKLVVLMMHAPIVRMQNREKLYELLKDRKYTFSISGHLHEQVNLFIGGEMGWKGPEAHHHLINATVSGSWWCGLHDETGIPHATMNDGAPNGYSVVSFDGNRYSIRFKAARRPASYQMNIYLDDEISSSESDTVTVQVNIFAGSERSIVEMQAGKGNDWIRMEKIAAIDPECLRMHRLSPVLDRDVDGQPLEEVFGYKMDYPSVSTHIWQANLPPDLPGGTHTLTVRTTDMFNQTWTGHRLFRVRSGK